jgi:hypothetical protein
MKIGSCGDPTYTKEDLDNLPLGYQLEGVDGLIRMCLGEVCALGQDGDAWDRRVKEYLVGEQPFEGMGYEPVAVLDGDIVFRVTGHRVDSP